MSQSRAGAATPARPAATPARRPARAPRPVSPHLQVWRWHVTMLASILHRASGVALYAGAVAIVAWLVCLALGPQTYGRFTALAASPLGLLVWAGLSAGLFYHLAAGLRHLLWDLGAGLTPPAASTLARLSIAFAVAATAVFWAALFISGKVSL